MKALPYIALVALFLTVIPRESSAQFSLGFHGGYNVDAFSDEGIGDGAYFLGGQARFGLQGLPLIVSPSIDYYFTGLDNVTVLLFNADVLFPFNVTTRRPAVVTPYLGLGLGVSRIMLDVDAPLIGDIIESDRTDYGLNVIGGVTFATGPVSPFVQARASLGEHLAFMNNNGEGGPGYMVSAGLLFRVGQ